MPAVPPAELNLDAIQATYGQGDSWIIFKRNELEAVVECHTIEYMASLTRSGTRAALLKFWRRAVGTSRAVSIGTSTHEQNAIQMPSRVYVLLYVL